MGLFTDLCSHCGKRHAKAAHYCTHCRKPTQTSWVRCDRCGAMAGPDSKHCHACGKPLADQTGGSFVADRWIRDPGMLAIKVEIRVPEAKLRHGVQIDEGTVAVLKHNGKFRSLLQPDYYEADTFWDRLVSRDGGMGDHLSASVVDVTSNALTFAANRLPDGFGMEVDMQVHLRFKIIDAEQFDVQMLKDRDQVEIGDLVHALQPRLENAARDFIAQNNAELLYRSPALREMVQESFGTSLKPAFAVLGAIIEEVSLAEVGGQAVMTIRQREARAAVQGAVQGIESKEAARNADHQIELARIRTFLSEEIKKLEENASASQHERDLLRRLRELEGRNQFDSQADLLAWKREFAKLQRKADTDAFTREQEALEAEHRNRLKSIKTKGDIAEIETWHHFHMKRLEQLHEVNGKWDKEEFERLHSQKLKSIDLITTLVSALANQEPSAVANAMAIMGVKAPPLPPKQDSSSSTDSNVKGALPFPLAEIYARHAPSIGVIVALSTDGQPPEALGTAWSWKRNWLATNAHVVEAVRRRKARGLPVEVRFGGSGNLRARILEERPHQHFDRFEVPVVKNRKAFSACDVGLLRVRDLPELRPLPVANGRVVQALRPGSSISYIGYPLEDTVAINLEHPSPMPKSGELTRVSNWQLVSPSGLADAAKSFLLQHSAPAAGGASGSPMFDEAGSVIGLVCSGNLFETIDLATKQRVRAALPGGVFYAQRVDLLDTIPTQF